MVLSPEVIQDITMRYAQHSRTQIMKLPPTSLGYFRRSSSVRLNLSCPGANRNWHDERTVTGTAVCGICLCVAGQPSTCVQYDLPVMEKGGLTAAPI